MKEQSLEHRIFRTVLPLMMAVLAYVLVYRLYNKEYLTVIFYALGLLVAAIVWKKSEEIEFFKKIVVPWIVFMVFFAVFFWFKTGGYQGGVLTFFTVIIFSILLAPTQSRTLIVISLVIIQILLLLTDVYLPQLYIWGENPKAHWDFIFLVLINSFLVWMLKINYDSKQVKINKFSSGLRELHRLNLRHDANLDDILNDYLSSGAALLDLECGVIISTKDGTHFVRNVNIVSGGNEENGSVDINPQLINHISETNETCYQVGQKSNFKEFDSFESIPNTFIGAPLSVQSNNYGIVLFSSNNSKRKRFEEYETEIIELMALNISHLLDMRFWKESQQKADGALRLSEKRFKSIYDHANVGICVCDMTGKIVMANKGVQEIYGYAEEEILDKTFYSFASSGDTQQMEVDLYNYERIILGEIDHYSIEESKLTKEGKLINVTKTVSTIKDENDQVQFTVMITDDISERKKDEEHIHELNTELAFQVGKLETVNQELETFSYSISHDLRAPLRAIDGFSKIILEDQKDQFNDESKRLLNIIIKNSGKMAMLIDDLLTFSRLSRQIDHFIPINFNNLVNDIIEEQALDRSIITIQELPVAKGEKTMMKQVLSNLIGNAVKFSSKKKEPLIEIGCVEKKSEYEFFVRDNGVGFNMAYYNKIFGVFHRLHTEAEFSGTGVGLSIVKKVMDKHRGRVWAESKEGKETIFYFTLPK